ncbi:MAG: hypothetical protein HFE73_01275 [Firmicutes bacterium]|nr:hypothetical protein [Bacillota bacterium]
MNIEKIEDRIGCYLISHVEEFVFDELSDSYLDRAGIADILMGVPIPIRKTAMTSLSTLDIARNMAFIIGCDPNFSYKENYIAYILRTFDVKFAEGLINDGIEGAQRQEYDYACIQFRAAMQIDPQNVDALYCYGRACKDAYEQGEEEDYIGRYKAESLEAFEQVTLRRPDFADGFYFLGYGYVNLGLYVKAKLTWEEYMKLTAAPTEDSAGGEALEKRRKEIQARLDSLKEPVEIEKGYNLVLSGRYVEGIDVLSPYKEGKFADWWPLWYYLGMAYSQLSEMEGGKEDSTKMAEEAITHLLHVLQLSPSNIETMEELVKLYRQLDNQEKALKYEKKIQVVKENAALDRAEAEAAAAAPTAEEKLN